MEGPPRIYPITFRAMADNRFKTYQVDECLATKSRNDARPESLRVDQDSIKLMHAHIVERAPMTPEARISMTRKAPTLANTCENRWGIAVAQRA